MYPLQIYNSLTRTKVNFIPANKERVTWYQCGPTVYAESHVGHARTYVTLDVVRRIMKEYLGYNIILCQNVTDIDDKIIMRSSEQNIPFLELAKKFEAEFFEDMASLGVQLPDMITRVSEYIPEIVEYINKLIEKGVAYASGGSVYFNTGAFEAKGQIYGKLVPEQKGNSDLLAEGEGALTVNDDKRNASDFVLWKKQKEHVTGIVEPYWESPWGRGRPGWHIECSAMSSCALDRFANGNLDIHAGGVDLKFPHHENEIAQSEGYQGCKQWVNYWLHTGHLNIKGFKMSKSLKNFITIRQALETHTSRQIRFCFLLHKYNSPMDYGDGTMTQAVNIEKIFSEYFHNVKAVLRRLGISGSQHLGIREHALITHLEAAKASVHSALMDDFDTPRAITALLELIRESNKYSEEDGCLASSVLLTNLARYITSILKIFGLVQDSSEIGFPLDSSAEGGSVSKEQVLSPLLDVLTKFRESVRIAAISGDTAAVLAAADALRDIVLPDLGVRMEDKGSGLNVVTVWKLDDPSVLKKERALKEEAKRAKELQKLELARKQLEKDEKAKISPTVMFLDQKTLYSAFDSTGMPTHDAAGEPLSKGALKKLQKDYDKQKESHEKHIAKAAIASVDH
jgi:cysteinyl-tRNA synthetase